MSVTELQFQAASVENAPAIAIEGRSQWQLTWRRLRSDKVAVASVIVIFLMIAFALAAPLIAQLTGHPVDQAYTLRGEDTSGLPVGPGVHGFILGTDQIGRDLLVRIAYGARISLFVGLLTTSLAVIFGVSLGLVAGYFGGIVDAILARFFDAALAFPFIILALALASVFHPNLGIVIGVITFFSWAGISRIVRGQTLSLKEKEYVEAARSLGAGPGRIMFIDILPNLLGPVLVLSTLYIPAAVTFEATLSFLGIGIPEPAPSWGNILSEAQNFYNTSWWYVVFPALALLITTLAFNLLGDGIRDAIDPRTERLFAGSKTSQRKRRKAQGKNNGGLDLDQAILVGQEGDLTDESPLSAGEG
ncbi:MAG TPA: ABC transporter permease [Streptosporangiaceae bacterium]|jgi:ABC-type dipeptide/oligopeptide/nickel transport system permease subunit